MEIAIDSRIPTYAGGLGILAGDTVRTAADFRIPLIAVTLLHRTGYFRQEIDEKGEQREYPTPWPVEKYLHERRERIEVTIEGRSVSVRSWEFTVTGPGGSSVPVIFLDTDLPENSEADRRLTDALYGGDDRYRLCQEVLLGIGGVRMLRKLGHHAIARFHMNEGHASLLVLELLDERALSAGRTNYTLDDVDAVHNACVFTTHTPVSAGYDRFPLELVEQVLGRRDALYARKDIFCCEGALNLTYLGFNLSHFVNGVAKRHGQISRQMHGRYKIDAITNGVHAATWTSPTMQNVFDRHIQGWRDDNASLRYALKIPREAIRDAHATSKLDLLRYAERARGTPLNVDALTIGFARRATAYKRADLLFHDLDRLRSIARHIGPLQILYAGKAHPRDHEGKELIRRIHQYQRALSPDVPVVYLPDYDLALAQRMVAGVDIWLNTPQPPLEASGTSGMKAALNGVPSFSVLDGWWLEGCIEGITGWAIGSDVGSRDIPAYDATLEQVAMLYDKLEGTIAPLYFEDPEGFSDVMVHSIAVNGSFFNSQRMMQQYVVKAYFL